METNVQTVIERQRKKYTRDGCPTLLQMICTTFRLSYQEFAKVFGISKSSAALLITHETMPSLELAIKMARYFEVTVEDLFGWRVDDEGMRRPLLVEIKGEYVRLGAYKRRHKTMALVDAKLEDESSCKK
jgi:DNA-binding XRE family transcriptional regulator